MTTGPDLLLTTRGCIIQMESQQEVQAKQNQGATDQISILGGRLRCGSIARVVEAQVGIVGSLHWQQAKNFQNSVTRRTSTSFKWGAKSTWGAYKQQGVSPHWCKKDKCIKEIALKIWGDVKTMCPFHLYSRDFFTTDRAFLQPYSTLCTGYLADLSSIEGFKASSSFLPPTTAAPKTTCCKGMVWGGLKDGTCSPKRGWSSLWVEPSGGVFSSILPTPVWLPVPVWHHLFLQGTGNIYLSGIIHSGCTIPKKIADFCFTGFF